MKTARLRTVGVCKLQCGARCVCCMWAHAMCSEYAPHGSLMSAGPPLSHEGEYGDRTASVYRDDGINSLVIRSYVEKANGIAKE